MTRYATILADPPWPGAWHGGGRGRHAAHRGLGYQSLPVAAIRELPVAEVAERDAALLLWVPAGFNREGAGVAVARAWGFTVVGEFIWSKGISQAGHFPRSCHEVLLVARRGAFRFPQTWLHSVQAWRKPPSSVIGAPNRHSAKPDAVYELAEAHCRPPYLELFARRRRAGWDAWGDQVADAVELVSA